MAVHDVYMDDVAAGSHNGAHVIAKPSEIGGQD
jgi:hypothetical protein